MFTKRRTQAAALARGGCLRLGDEGGAAVANRRLPGAPGQTGVGLAPADDKIDGGKAMASGTIKSQATAMPLWRARFGLPAERVVALCRRWGIAELSLFGSALREDFGPASDVDVLVTFAPGQGYTFESLPDLLDELSELFHGRRIDLVEKSLITNPFRRHAILTSRQVLYAA